MIVRVRLKSGPQVRQTKGKNREVIAAIAALLWPAVLGAYVLGVWGLFAEIKLAGKFGINDGLYSHWQAWFATAISLHLAAVLASHYGREGYVRLPSDFFAWVNHFRRAAD